LIGRVSNAASAGETVLASVSGAVDALGLVMGVGVGDSVDVGSAVGVCVCVGVLTLVSGSDELPDPKKLQRMKTVTTAPTMALVLLRDLKLHGLNYAV
jgi:hypothetical protein